jgi:hypothetical protein
MLKGLDDYIMGVHDSNAPFNQVDWVDEYHDIIVHCNWLTDDMIGDDETYCKLGEIISETIEIYIGDNLRFGKFYGRRVMQDFIKDNAKEIAIIFKQNAIKSDLISDLSEKSRQTEIEFIRGETKFQFGFVYGISFAYDTDIITYRCNKKHVEFLIQNIYFLCFRFGWCTVKAE